MLFLAHARSNTYNKLSKSMSLQRPHRRDTRTPSSKHLDNQEPDEPSYVVL